MSNSNTLLTRTQFIHDARHGTGSEISDEYINELTNKKLIYIYACINNLPITHFILIIPNTLQETKATVTFVFGSNQTRPNRWSVIKQQ